MTRSNRTSESTPTARRGAKVGHKKSRNGCMKCKTRRVKCDERTPICNNCERLGLSCQWPHRSNISVPSPEPTSSRSSERNVSQEPSYAEPSYAEPSQVVELGPTAKMEMLERLQQPNHGVYLPSLEAMDIDLPESRERRMMEHRLMQHYLFSLGTFGGVAPPHDWTQLFRYHIPELALKHDNLFYSLLTVSATSLLQSTPDDTEVFKARQAYLIAAVRAQREMVGHLRPEFADAICLASVLLLVYSFGVLGERSHDNGEPYTPPVQWLEMGKGVGLVMWLSYKSMPKNPDPKPLFMQIILNRYPHFDDESYFDASMREKFDSVLTQALESGDDWSDTDTREAYEKTLSYVGSIQLAITQGEPMYAVGRRIQTFAILVPNKFTELLTEMRPRALVVLAYFFATVVQVDGVWWLGKRDSPEEKMAAREIRAISNILPKAWRGLMIWPRDMAGLPAIH